MVFANLFTRKDSITENVAFLFNEIGISFNKHTLIKKLFNSPNYPSLGSVQHVLKEYNLKHLTIKINVEQLSEVPLPCLLHIKDAHDEGLAILTEVKPGELIYIFNGNKIACPTDEFTKIWTGNSILIEKSDLSGEPGYHKNIFLFWTKLIVLLLSILCGLGTVYLIAAQLPLIVWKSFFLILILIFGVLLSAILIYNSYNGERPLMQQLCFGKKKNCNNVLNSELAQIKGVKLAEIALIYFTGFLLTFLYLSFLGHRLQEEVINWLSISCILALPLTLVLIYYQGFVKKEYCYLCLLLTGILWLKSAILLTAFNYYFSSFSLSVLIFTFGLTIAFWFIIRPFFIKSFENDQLRSNLKNIKSNPAVINALLTSGGKIHAPAAGESGIVLASEGAQFTIVIVSNVFCKPCAVAHKKIHKLLKEQPGKFNVNIIFSTSLNNKFSEIVTRHLITIAIYNPVLAMEATNDWFENASEDYIDRWKTKYPVINHQQEEVEKIHLSQINWIKEANLTYTPVVIAGNRILPKELDILDLTYLRNHE